MKKNIICAVFITICLSMVVTFYARGESGDRDFDLIKRQQLLRDPIYMMSIEEKLYHVSRSMTKDFRPVKKEPVLVKGIYMSGRVFQTKSLFERLVNLVDETELNSLIIDVKDDDGALTTDLNVPLAHEIKARVYKKANVEKNMELLYEKGIYPIARIVVFKDPTLAEGRPDLAIKRTDGSIWRDRKGLAWVDPNSQKVWEYAVDIAKEAAKMGFREIQFDYVRFPTDGDVKNAIYPYSKGQKKEDVIKDFLHYANNELEPYNVYLSADVFGLTTLTLDDMGMGQKFEKIITVVDYICPMIYPSHYGPGNYGFANPNAYPYEIVKNALLDARKKAKDSEVIIRPWLQDFNLGSPSYGAEEVKAQIQATYDVGINEWILWNAGNRYTESALTSP